MTLRPNWIAIASCLFIKRCLTRLIHRGLDFGLADVA